MEPLHTERLTLHPMSIGHAEFLLGLLNSPTWIQYVGDRNVHTIEDAEKYVLNGPQKTFEENGYGSFVIEDTSTKKLVGTCGLLKRVYLDSPDIGYALLPEYEGNGYAVEASRAVLTNAKEKLGIKSVYAFTTPENGRSRGLIQKLGFNFEREMKSETGEDLLVYKLEL